MEITDYSFNPIVDMLLTEIDHLTRRIKGLECSNNRYRKSRERCATQYNKECGHLNQKIKHQQREIEKLREMIK
jgi:predicted RNase H-like nuclease (RuvC/YqgF family)